MSNVSTCLNQVALDTSLSHSLMPSIYTHSVPCLYNTQILFASINQINNIPPPNSTTIIYKTEFGYIKLVYM